MARDLLHILPLFAPQGRSVAVCRDDYGTPYSSNIHYPPIAIASAAAWVRHHGFQVEILAADALGLSVEQTVERARAASPSVIHVPMTWASHDEDCHLLRMLRHALPQARIVVSGPNLALCPEALLAPGVDGITLADEALYGEIEPVLLDCLQHPDGAHRPNRTVFRAGKLVQGAHRLEPSLTYMVTPARELLPKGRYHLPFSRRTPATYLETSRGCIYGCSFCFPVRSIYEGKQRYRPLEQVFQDIDAVIAQGYREVVLKDLNFLVRRDRVEAFCEYLISKGKPLVWRCMGTVDRVDALLLSLMKRSGCYQICYGFESGDQAVLSASGKGVTVAQGVTAARLTAQAGIEVAGTFMLGLPGDSPDSMEATIRFALDEPVTLAQFTPCVAIPGTPLARAQGLLDQAPVSPGELFDYARSGNIIPAGELDRTLRSAYRRFYFRPRVVMNRLSSLTSLEQLQVQASAGWAVVRNGLG